MPFTLFQAKFLKDCGVNDICESALEVVADIHLHRYEILFLYCAGYYKWNLLYGTWNLSYEMYKTVNNCKSDMIFVLDWKPSVH